jgi:hypothetical protein
VKSRWERENCACPDEPPPRRGPAAASSAVWCAGGSASRNEGIGRLAGTWVRRLGRRVNESGLENVQNRSVTAGVRPRREADRAPRPGRPTVGRTNPMRPSRCDRTRRPNQATEPGDRARRPNQATEPGDRSTSRNASTQSHGLLSSADRHEEPRDPTLSSAAGRPRARPRGRPHRTRRPRAGG